MVGKNGSLKGIDRSNKIVDTKFREVDVLLNDLDDRKIGKHIILKVVASTKTKGLNIK